MAVWLLDEDNRRVRLLDPFRPTFYLAGPRYALDTALRALPRRGCPLTTRWVERRELGSPDPVPVLEVAVHQPSQFPTLVRGLLQQCDQVQFYHVDVPLPQRYFYERGLFPLARCEAEVTVDGTIRAIHAVDSPWDTGYATPPLSILELSLEGHASNPNHGGAFRLAVRVEGEERCLEGDDGVELVARLNQLLHRHDPDVILTDWGDSYILPRLLMLASRVRLPLALNRDAERLIGMQAPRSYFSYGRILANAGARTLYGRLHVDRQNSFVMAETGFPGLIEQARVTKVPLQHMARTTTGTGITAMQLETAHHDGILIPYRKREPEEFKSALELLHTDQGGLVYAPVPGYHENVGELDFASMYPSIMTRFNISPETVNCSCCAHDPAARVPEIGHHTCRHRTGLVPRTLTPLLYKRAQYKRLLATTTDPTTRQVLDQRQTALKWLLVVSFGYLGYKNARFGRIEAHESVTAHSREILLQAKETAEHGGFRLLHAIVDSLWVHKPGATRGDYEALARAIAVRTTLPIVVEGVYRWIGFLPSRVDPRMPVHNQFVGMFETGESKIRGLEIRRADAPLIVKKAQAEVLRCLSRAQAVVELRAQVASALEIIRAYRRYLQDGRASLEDLMIAKSISREPQTYRHRTMTAIAAWELLGQGVRLQPGETIHYVITDAAAPLAEDRVRAVATLDGAWSYDAGAYETLLLKSARVILAPLGLNPTDLDHLTDPRA
ncbi:MAG: DNA polymerase domain-containing protein [Nitrospiraceae bacterium]